MKTLKIAHAKLLADVIAGIQQNNVPGTFQFGLTLAQNQMVLEPFVKEYEKKRQELITQFSNKDEKGNRLTKPDGNADMTDQNRTAYFEAMQDFGEGEVELDLRTMPSEEFPKGDIGAGFVSGLIHLIEKPSAGDNPRPRPSRKEGKP